MVENPDNPRETLVAVFDEGKVRFVRQLEQRGRILVPIPRSAPELAGQVLFALIFSTAFFEQAVHAPDAVHGPMPDGQVMFSNQAAGAGGKS